MVDRVAQTEYAARLSKRLHSVFCQRFRRDVAAFLEFRNEGCRRIWSSTQFLPPLQRPIASRRFSISDTVNIRQTIAFCIVLTIYAP
jgi:hypothetical protein